MAHAPIFNTGDKSQEIQNLRSVDLQGRLKDAESKTKAPKQLDTALGNAAKVFLAFNEGEKRKQAAQELLKAGEAGVLSYGQTQGLKDEDMGWVSSVVRTAKSTEEGTARAYKMIDDMLKRQQEQKELELGAKNKGGSGSIEHAFSQWVANNPEASYDDTLKIATTLGLSLANPVVKEATKRKNTTEVRAITMDKAVSSKLSKLGDAIEPLTTVIRANSDLKKLRGSLKHGKNEEVIKNVAGSFSTLLATAGSDSILENVILTGIKKGIETGQEASEWVEEVQNKVSSLLEGKTPEERAELFKEYSESLEAKKQVKQNLNSYEVQYRNAILDLLRQKLKAMSGATVSGQEEGFYKALIGLSNPDPRGFNAAIDGFIYSTDSDMSAMMKANTLGMNKSEYRKAINTLRSRGLLDEARLLELGAGEAPSPEEPVIIGNTVAQPEVLTPPPVPTPSKQIVENKPNTGDSKSISPYSNVSNDELKKRALEKLMGGGR